MKLRLIPEQASTFAEQMDPLFYVLTLLTAIFTSLVFVLMIYLAVRYRRSNKVDRSRPHHEHLPLELTWTIIPLLLGLGVFVWGAKLFAMVFGPAPPDALEVFVIGKQWMWHLQHSNGVRENNELHIPVGRPVKLTMISQDVIHDFFVPEFRIHMDVVPGRNTTTWFTPTKVGRYHIFCAQYCGTDHSKMTGFVYVMEPSDYAKWLANGGDKITAAPPKTLAQLGRDIYDLHACGQCHDPDGMQRGPGLDGLYGSVVTTRTGKRMIADHAYLRESILNPSEEIAEKYQQIMPSYKGQLTEEQVLQLIAYIKSLSGKPDLSGEPVATADQGAATGTSAPAPANSRGVQIERNRNNR